MINVLRAHAAVPWKLCRTRMGKDLMWSASGQIILALTGLFGIRILTELASPDVFGTANLLIAALTVGINVVVAPVSNTQTRYHSKFAAEGRAEPFSAEILKLSLAAAVGVAVMVTLSYGLWLAVGGGRFSLALGFILLVWAPIYAFRNFLINRVHAERRQARLAAWQSIEAVAILATTAWLLSRAPTTEMFLAGTVVAVALVGILFLMSSPRDRIAMPRKGAERAQVVGLIRTYGLPFVLLNVLSWIGNLSERYVLAGTLGVAAAGIYAASFGISSRAQLLLGGIAANAFRPALFEAESHGDSARGRLLYWIWIAATAIFSAAMVLSIWLLAPVIAEFLLSEEYRAGAPALMTLVAAGYGFQNVNQVVEIRIMSLDKSGRLIRPMILGGAGNLVLAILLIPVMGVPGAALAIAASFLLQLMATLWALRTLRARC